MTLVQSGGQLTQVAPVQTGPLLFRESVELYEDRFADYASIWRTQPAVRRVISFKARNIAQLSLVAFRRATDTDRQPLGIAEHGLARTLAMPNPWTTPYDLVYALVSDLAVYDRALWVKFPVPGRVGVVRLPPSRWRPIGNNWDNPSQFQVMGRNGETTLERDEVVYFRGYDPDGYGGSSPMESLRQVIAEEVAAAGYREHMWRNGARMEHVITRPAEAPKMSPEAKDRFWARWNAQYTGTAASGKTALLEEGMDVKPVSFSAKDAQYAEVRKLNLAEVAGFFHILPQAIGILDNATYSNMESANKQLYQGTFGPDLISIPQRISLDLVPEYTVDLGAPPGDEVFCGFDVSEKLKGSFAEQARSIQTLVGGPVLTRNEGRALLNRGTIEGADELIVPLNVTAGGQASPTDSAPPGQPDEIGDPSRPDPSQEVLA